MSATMDRSSSKVPEVTLLFWIIKIAATTLGETGGDALSMGAVVGDFLDKPLDAGGLALSRYAASAALLTLIVACILFFPQRAASRSH
jgi:uncharacterized membrane-anchored protein